MAHLRVATVGFLPVLLLAGCGIPGQVTDPSDDGTVGSELVTSNGHLQNGHLQNGHLQNGPGLAMGGADLKTMSRLINGAPAGTDPDVSPSNLAPIAGTHLVGSMLTGASIAGTAFQWHVVQGWVTDNVNKYPATYYIENIFPSASDPEIYKYRIRALHPVLEAGKDCTKGGCQMVWDDACGSYTKTMIINGKPVTATIPYLATAVGGQWNYQEGVPGGGRKEIEQGNPDYDTKITFACETGAIDKCVEKMGYKPWKMGPNECDLDCFGMSCSWDDCQQRTLELAHEACVRMVRADYCGDGKSHTMDGISIDVWDYANINTMTNVSTDYNGYGHEAEWTPRGARCMNNVLMTRASADTDGQRMDYYLTHQNTCINLWGSTWDWASGDCFGNGPTSNNLVNSWIYSNRPSDTWDWHNRVMIRNTSMCITDRNRTNSYFAPPCITL